MSNIKRLVELHKLAPSKYIFKAEGYSEIAPAADFYNAVYDELPKLCADLEAANEKIAEYKKIIEFLADKIDVCPKPDSDWDCDSAHKCSDCWFEYFRTKAEKGVSK